MRWPRLATDGTWPLIARLPVLTPSYGMRMVDEAAYPVGSRSAMPWREPTAMPPREYACDRYTHFGRLDKALDEARKAG